ncbi:hypothetical protein MLD38_010629 [Melastoma candidum]|uniref:Uncharacterized protein n=1 Tax=Melastoma candidum TaxID=119954 RepID=A0ACB9QZY6_9MYRT|nr:hypothetical protein MLD38_010629 [Melastoma candidum]
MGSVANPKTWVPIPYTNIRDCSRGLCSLYCPQWCFLVFPPPPPPPPSSLFPDSNSDLKLPPFVIAIIAVLACAVLLVGYYLLISKYCCSRGNPAQRRSEEGDPSSSRFDNDHDPSFHMAWQVETIGLDESVIRSITVCCYKKGIGLIEGTCSVCLSEFEEDENVRLLPKCAHAFHIPCIDTWLKSHSTCPLCRSEIAFTGPFPVPSPLLMERVAPHPLPSLMDGTTVEVQEANYGEKEDGTSAIENPSGKLPSWVRSDLGSTRDAIIEIEEDRMQGLRRTMSMDHSCQDHLLATGFVVVCRSGQSEYGGSSSQEPASRFHCKVFPGKMKRSLSSDRLPISGQGTLSNGTIPGR